MKDMPRKLLATLISFVLLATMLPVGVSLPGAPARVVGGYALAESEGAEPSPTSDGVRRRETRAGTGNARRRTRDGG